MEKDGSKLLYPDAQFQYTKISQDPPPYSHKPLLGPENTMTMCQFCNATITTDVKYTVTVRTHLVAAICGLLCCCCCLPYFTASAKNTDHYCPYCEKYLGTYEK